MLHILNHSLLGPLSSMEGVKNVLLEEMNDRYSPDVKMQMEAQFEKFRSSLERMQELVIHTRDNFDLVPKKKDD